MKVKLTTIIRNQADAFMKIHKYSRGSKNEMEK